MSELIHWYYDLGAIKWALLILPPLGVFAGFLFVLLDTTTKPTPGEMLCAGSLGLIGGFVLAGCAPIAFPLAAIIGLIYGLGWVTLRLHKWVKSRG